MIFFSKTASSSDYQFLRKWRRSCDSSQFLKYLRKVTIYVDARSSLVLTITSYTLDKSFTDKFSYLRKLVPYENTVHRVVGTALEMICDSKLDNDLIIQHPN
jgi:hypothetical protein